MKKRTQQHKISNAPTIGTPGKCKKISGFIDENGNVKTYLYEYHFKWEGVEGRGQRS